MTVAPGNEVGSCCEYLKKLLYKKNSCDLLQIVVFQTEPTWPRGLLEASQQKLGSFHGKLQSSSSPHLFRTKDVEAHLLGTDTLSLLLTALMG